MTTSIIEIRTAALQSKLVELKAQLQEALAREVLVEGQVYQIHVGKGDTAAVISATLVGQRARENGAVEFRFSAGVGFDARYYDLSFSKVVTDVEGMSSNKIAQLITRTETALADVENYVPGTRAAGVFPRIVLVVGGVYSIKTGRGETAAVSQVQLLAERDNEQGNQEFAVFVGAGFDAKVLIVNSKRFVLEGQDAASEEEEAADDAAGIDLDAEYTEAAE